MYWSGIVYNQLLVYDYPSYLYDLRIITSDVLLISHEVFFRFRHSQASLVRSGIFFEYPLRLSSPAFCAQVRIGCVCKPDRLLSSWSIGYFLYAVFKVHKDASVWKTIVRDKPVCLSASAFSCIGMECHDRQNPGVLEVRICFSWLNFISHLKQKTSSVFYFKSLVKPVMQTALPCWWGWYQMSEGSFTTQNFDFSAPPGELPSICYLYLFQKVCSSFPKSLPLFLF